MEISSGIAEHELNPAADRSKPPPATRRPRREIVREGAAERLWNLRRRRHATSKEAVDAMKAAGLNVNHITFYHHELGWRPLTWPAAVTYGRYFNVSAGFLLSGSDVSHTMITGAVDDRGKVSPDETEAEWVVAPPDIPPERLAALRIASGDMWPTYRPGDVLFYDVRTFDQPVDWHCVEGRECIIHGRYGAALVRGVFASIERTEGGRATLLTYSGEPRKGVTIEHAAPVLWIKRAQGPNGL